MDLPKIDISTMPDLPHAAGLFGAGAGASIESDDTLIVLMSFIYESHP